MSNVQTVGLLKDVMKHMQKSVNDGKEIKTLSDSYLNVLSGLNLPMKDEYKKDLVNDYLRVYSIKDYLEKIGIPEELEDGKYKAVHDKSVTVKRLDAIKNEISHALQFSKDSLERKCQQELNGDEVYNKKEKASFYSEEAMDLLEQSIKHNHLITHFNEQHRGIGKTSAIIQKAHDEGYSILCSSNSQVEAVIYRAQSMGINDLDVYSQHSNLAGKKYKNFLVDELVDSKNMAKISEQGHKIIGGFYRIVVCF